MVRPLRLAKVAARAEVLLIRRQMTAMIRRAVMGVIAGVFAIAALILLHVIGYIALEQYGHLAPILAAASVLGVDVLFTALFGILASRNTIDPMVEEARRLRDTSIEQARQSLSLASLAAPLTRIVADAGLLKMVFRLLGSVVRRGPKVAR